MPSGDTVVFESFEWDAEKNRSNSHKHGIGFNDALFVFSDPLAVSFEARRDHNEDRRLIVGRVRGVLITVVFTIRGERVRIISARRSRISERVRYGQ